MTHICARIYFPMNSSVTMNGGGWLDQLRRVRDGLLYRQQFHSAAFLCDKIMASEIMPSADDVFAMAYCLYNQHEYHRSAHVIVSRNLQKKHVRCCLLTIKCYYKCKNYFAAIKLVKDALLGKWNLNTAPQTEWRVALLVMRSVLNQATNNHKCAKEALFSALETNFTCYEAFHMLTNKHLITKSEEVDLLNSLIAKNKVHSPFLCAFMRFFYYTQMKKYDRPDNLKIYVPFEIFTQNSDVMVSQAESFYYNYHFVEALEVTNRLLARDLHNMECLAINIACLMMLSKVTDLFELAQTLIDLYPEREVPWFALGSYYHLTDKVDLARRFLLKSTSLNSYFAPSWLLYGQSFTQEAEHDQAISTYFKAFHFMPGCHLPLLNIGMEYILTANYRLAEKFIKTSLTIAPEDPLALHELAIISYHSKENVFAENYLRSALQVLDYNPQPDAVNLPTNYHALLHNMGLVLRNMRRYEEAIEFHKQALLLAPQDYNSYLTIGVCHCLLNDWSSAAHYIDQANALLRLMGLVNDETMKIVKHLLEVYVLREYDLLYNKQRNEHLNSTLNRFNDNEYLESICEKMPPIIKPIEIKGSNEKSRTEKMSSTFVANTPQTIVWLRQS